MSDLKHGDGMLLEAHGEVAHHDEGSQSRVKHKSHPLAALGWGWNVSILTNMIVDRM